MRSISFGPPINYGTYISVGNYKKYKFIGKTYGSPAVNIIYRMEESLLVGCDFYYGMDNFEETHIYSLSANEESTCINIYPDIDTYPIPKVDLAKAILRDFSKYSLEWSADINYFRRKRKMEEEEYRKYMDRYREREKSLLDKCKHLENAITGRTERERIRKIKETYGIKK